ncbi:hypothetical protein [Blastococcus sp. TF02A-26]|uniref:hypothetical protein n=1 Tax=Blastococcus sp. TF02A-26 TaxID=2250577 RepID=UPI000DE90A52|nr:hypothetical protein [Blastococcus sp. TF02A-26]RBY82676.1 hypothetical protein DQ240_18455 [Blastococcus sp. TF02A-26]
MTRARAGLRAAAIAAAGTAAALAGRLVRRWPGLAALVCAVAGVWTLAGYSWALVTASAFALLADYRAA